MPVKHPRKIGILPPKWMVKIMENPIKMDDLGVPPLFLETPILDHDEITEEIMIPPP